MIAVIFIPFFGTLPSYFQAFLHSCEHLNGYLDFIVFSDDINIKTMKMPSNVRYIIVEFKDIQQIILNLYGSVLYSPYKLCDYRPCYGQIFECYTQNYPYWGYCDIDLVLGDLVGWLKSIDYEKYDRIGRYGHFTLYKNSDDIRPLFKSIVGGVPNDFIFENVIKTTYPCNFDECGMNWIIKKENRPFLEANSVFNSSEPYLHFHTWNHRFDYQIITWESGHVFSYSRQHNTSEIKKEEASYAHFQTIKNMLINEPLGDAFILTHKGIFRFDPNEVSVYLNKYGSPDSLKERFISNFLFYTSRIRRCFSRYINEIKFNGPRSCCIIFRRMKLYLLHS